MPQKVFQIIILAQPEKKKKTIVTLTNLTTKKLKIYYVKIQNVNEKYSFNTKLKEQEREKFC